MTFEVDINGKSRTVAVEPIPDTEGRFRIVVDGHEQLVDARKVDQSTLSLIFLDGGIGHEIELVESGVAGELMVRTHDGLLRAEIDARRRRRGGAGGSGGKAGEQRVTAPMPGKIVRVLVKAGDEVKARQGVVVMEAMKMECELTSPKAGTVKEIAVEVGASVEAGRLLAVVE